MEFFNWIYSVDGWVSLITLAFLEIVLGIDNIIFLAILCAKLPTNQQQKGRILGLFFAMFMRIGLLLSLSWIMSLTKPFFHIGSFGVTGRDLVLILGGGFLVIKATKEIVEILKNSEHKQTEHGGDSVSFWGIIMQIALLDIVFSLDSVITAVGMANHIPVMIIAIVIAVIIMMFASKPISDFIDTHPTIKVLALAFLVLVGIALVADGLGYHVKKGYIYFAMGFSLFVELLNIKIRKNMEINK